MLLNGLYILKSGNTIFTILSVHEMSGLTLNKVSIAQQVQLQYKVNPTSVIGQKSELRHITNTSCFFLLKCTKNIGTFLMVFLKAIGVIIC